MSNLIFLTGLARKLDLPLPKARRLVAERVLVPDARTDKGLLFDADRLPELRAKVAAAEGAVR